MTASCFAVHIGTSSYKSCLNINILLYNNSKTRKYIANNVSWWWSAQVKGSEVLTHDGTSVAYALCSTETVSTLLANILLPGSSYNIASLDTILSMLLENMLKSNTNLFVELNFMRYLVRFKKIWSLVLWFIAFWNNCGFWTNQRWSVNLLIKNWCLLE